MLRSTRKIIGYHIRATDEEIGTARDLCFDDQSWRFRYLVVDTGVWLPGRQVLVSPESMGEPNWNAQTIPVDLSKSQIEQSPPVGTDQPVSRQHEAQLAAYYGWHPYWAPGPLAGVVAAAPKPAESTEGPEGDPHLRSLNEVLGYHIEATDGRIGHVEDVIAETDDWTVRYVVVDTRDWLPGKKVLISPEWAERIDWSKGAVHLNLAQEQVRDAPKFDPSSPVNREYEERLYDYYGRPPYWRPDTATVGYGG